MIIKINQKSEIYFKFSLKYIQELIDVPSEKPPSSRQEEEKRKYATNSWYDSLGPSQTSHKLCVSNSSEFLVMFNNFFGKKPTAKGEFDIFMRISLEFNTKIVEQQRENDRSLRKAGRDIERERRKLEEEERKLVENMEFTAFNMIKNNHSFSRNWK